MADVHRDVLVVLGAVSAILGGAFWAIKAGAIMITEVQPQVIYEIAPFFFAVAVMGLYDLLDHPRPGYAKLGTTLAAGAALASMIAIAGLFLGPPEWEPAGDTVTLLTPFIVSAAVGTLSGLLLVGVAAARTHALVGSAATLPIALSLSTFPLIALGGVLESIHPRLFEAPTFVLGVGWIALGIVMARQVHTRTPYARTATD